MGILFYSTSRSPWLQRRLVGYFYLSGGVNDASHDLRPCPLVAPKRRSIGPSPHRVLAQPSSHSRIVGKIADAEWTQLWTQTPWHALEPTGAAIADVQNFNLLMIMMVGALVLVDVTAGEMARPP